MDFLHIHLIIHQGKTVLSQPRFRFPSECNITETPNHWANESTSTDLPHHISSHMLKRKEKKRKEDEIP